MIRKTNPNVNVIFRLIVEAWLAWFGLRPWTSLLEDRQPSSTTHATA